MAAALQRARAQISALASGASPHSAEVSAKPSMPNTNSRRRPRRSPSRLPAISSTP